MEKRKNYSKKREAILKALCSTDCHPTAEWIYQTLKSDYPDLSLGTVYRNLSQFKNDGVIISVGVVNGQERFDGNVLPHTHLICEQCNAVVDVPGNYVSPEACKLAAQTYNAEIHGMEVVFRGVCSDCLKKQKLF